MKRFLAALAGLLAIAHAIPDSGHPSLQPRADTVTVILPLATVVGSVTDVESFNGVPFAEPPLDQLRLRPPKRLSRPVGIVDATGTAPDCPQMPRSIDNETTRLFERTAPEIFEVFKFQQGEEIQGQEDCLTVSVQRPKGTQATDKLPVLFYIFGGAFEFGGTASNNPEAFVRFAQSQNQSFIFVGVNYRLAGFGVRPDSFVWGNATYKGKPLFHGAMMSGGSVLATEPVDSPKAQAIYDNVVDIVGCNQTANTLDCLRHAPFKDLYHAINTAGRVNSYAFLALPYLPRPDGQVLTQSPDFLAKEGKYHAVPVIIGDQEDEGTIFSLTQTDVNSSDRLVDYFAKYFFHRASREQVAGLVGTYPTDSAAGSPFRTGDLNEYYQLYSKGNGFKRLAALSGDITFTLTRRLAIEAMDESNPNVPIWSYLGSSSYGVPYLGSFHGSEILLLFSGIGPAAQSSRAHYLNFIYNQDPNIECSRASNGQGGQRTPGNCFGSSGNLTI
ncbi:hypothetical protein ACCO45_011880 [Purpureocillium lilacinum]|uniref:Uncharacterized protein n=1 Tax=Purpureocillium lilacinum TaxID=33203 RepID=A0ACC4DEB3_PURLI